MPKFGGGIKCPVCTKTVYAMEALKFEEHTYHKTCFQCCKCHTKLSMKNFATVNDKLFCKAHFREAFSEGGGRYSFVGREEGENGDDVLLTTRAKKNKNTAPPPPPPAEDVIPEQEEEEEVVEEKVIEEEETPVPPTPEPSPKVEEPPTTPPAKEKAKKRNKSTPSAASREKPPVNTKSLSPKPTRKFGGGGIKCPVCVKTVYAMEALNFEGKTYHKNCFKCCKCQSKLSMGNFATVNDKLFCKAHFREAFSEGGGRYSFVGRGEGGVEGAASPASPPPPPPPPPPPVAVSPEPEEVVKEEEAEPPTPEPSPPSSPKPLTTPKSPKPPTTPKLSPKPLSPKLSPKPLSPKLSPKPLSPKLSPPRSPKAGILTEKEKLEREIRQLQGGSSVSEMAKKQNQARPVSPKVERPKGTPSPTKKFGGGGIKCPVCTKTVYAMEALKFEGNTYHKTCFQCCKCHSKLSMGNFATVNDKLFCKAHFREAFSEGGGRYSFVGRE